MEPTPGRRKARRRPAPVGDISFAAAIKGLEWLEDGRRALDWNGPTGRAFTRFREEDLDGSIVDHLERAARRYPERVAITDSDTSLSFAQVWAGLSGLAETIAAETHPGDLVGILLPACPMFPVAMLACLAAGRPFVALDTNYPSDWVGQVLADARPALILGREDVRTACEAGPPTTRFMPLTRLPQAARAGWRATALGPDQPACVLFTSGTTGRPKGIVNSQRNLLQRVAQSMNAAHINAEDRFLTLASLCTVVGVRDMMTALLAGASLHLLDPQRVGAREIVNVIRAEAITILFAFPALLRSVVAGEGRAGDHLRLVRVGGDTTLWSDIDLLRAWLAPQAAIQLIYAATEAPMMQWFVDDACREDDERIPIGYPLPGNRLAVIGDDGRPTPPGEAGELVVCSPYVALGLWVDGRCVADGPQSRGARPRRVFRSGDLVRQRPDGLLERLGRKDRQVKIGGARVELDGVEAALRQHAGVRDVGVLARRGRPDGAATLVAYVSARDEASAGLLDDLRAMMRAAPASMRPARLYLAPTIPRLPSSKLDTRALMALDQATVQTEQANAAAGAAPAEGDRIARTVATVWQDVLQTPVGGPQDDFFEVGDSLQAITLVIQLEEALGLELPLTLIHETPTFAGLCQALRTHRTAGYTPLVPLKAGDGSSPPVFFIHGVGGSVADLFPIARRMTYPGAVIGIQARGLGRQEAPHATVEAMAAEYLSAMKARQPVGPYYLCGYSFGGLVAFEMARRLREAGDEVGLVGLFDTTPSSLGWPAPVWLAFVRRRMLRIGARAAAAPIRAWPAAAGRVCGRLGGWLTRRRPNGPPLPAALKSAPTGVLRVAASGLIASARYRPGYYPGDLTLFSPAGRDPALPSLQAIWRSHAAALSIIDTAGSHLTMLSTPNADAAAESLTQRLPQALRKKS